MLRLEDARTWWTPRLTCTQRTAVVSRAGMVSLDVRVAAREDLRRSWHDLLAEDTAAPIACM